MHLLSKEGAIASVRNQVQPKRDRSFVLCYGQRRHATSSLINQTTTQAMTSTDSETDEDRQITRLKIHRDLIGWIISELRKEGIQAERTTGSNPNGDILIVDQDKIVQVKELLRQIQTRFNS